MLQWCSLRLKKKSNGLLISQVRGSPFPGPGRITFNWIQLITVKNTSMSKAITFMSWMWPPLSSNCPLHYSHETYLVGRFVWIDIVWTHTHAHRCAHKHAHAHQHTLTSSWHTSRIFFSRLNKVRFQVWWVNRNQESTLLVTVGLNASFFSVRFSIPFVSFAWPMCQWRRSAAFSCPKCYSTKKIVPPNTPNGLCESERQNLKQVFVVFFLTFTLRQ